MRAAAFWPSRVVVGSFRRDQMLTPPVGACTANWAMANLGSVQVQCCPVTWPCRNHAPAPLVDRPSARRVGVLLYSVLRIVTAAWSGCAAARPAWSRETKKNKERRRLCRVWATNEKYIARCRKAGPLLASPYCLAQFRTGRSPAGGSRAHFSTRNRKKKIQQMCGCWDSSPGLHGHNVEFSPLNYSHICCPSSKRNLIIDIRIWWLLILHPFLTESFLPSRKNKKRR